MGKPEMPRRNPHWSRPTGRPFTPAEDQELCAMVRCGLASEYYQDVIPNRPFGEILTRRLELIEAGQLARAREI